jgi:transposase
MFDPARLVFIDETAASTKMVRLRGRCPRGERLVGSVPHGHWKTITLVAGLRHDGMVAPFVIDGPMNGRAFLAYVEQCLAPTLDRGDIVIMDNLPTHKVGGVTKAIHAADAIVIFLPAYSPDLNPIEQVFSKLKSSASSKRSCARPLSAQFQASGEESAQSCVPSARRSV